MVINSKTEEVQDILTQWFEKEGRDFPWRNTNNPFHILISEKLLQQTIARKQVIDAYEKLISNYPTAEELANAKTSAIKEIIRPLGLLYRANELRILAREIVQKHNGVVPKSLKDLLSLPGVGDYSARAILSFAYNEDEPIVDTNVARFLHRFLGIKGDISQNPARSKLLRSYAKEFIPAGNSRQYNFALLDFCALVCCAKKPKCIDCPILHYCKSPFLESVL